MTRRIAAAVALWILALSPAASRPAGGEEIPPGSIPYALEAIPFGGGGHRDLRAWERDGVIFAPAEDLARVLGIPFAWRPEIGKFTLRGGGRSAWLLEGSEFVSLDGGGVLQLPAPAVLWEGKLIAPLDLLVNDRGEGRPWIGREVRFSREDHVLAAAPWQRAQIEDLDIVADPLGWKLVLTADAPFRVRVNREEPASMIFVLEGAEFDPLLFLVPGDHPWFQGLRLRALENDVELAFVPARGAQGWRMETRLGGRVLEIFLGLDERDLREGRIRPFRSEPGVTPGSVSVIALDPGHGDEPGPAGADARVAQDLSRRVQMLLAARLGLAVVLTREGGENPSAETRADRANRAGAGLLLSIHTHERAGGAAAFVGTASGAPDPPRTLAELGFRPFPGAQDGFLSWSRLFARCLLEGVAGRLETRASGIYDESLVELTGAAMPAALLELPLGQSPPGDADLDRLAEGIVEGIRLYMLSGEEY